MGELTCSRNVVGVAGPRVSFSWADTCGMGAAWLAGKRVRVRLRLRVLTCGMGAADASFIDGYLLRICFAASPVSG